MSARRLARVALGIACVAGCLAAAGPAGAAVITPNTFGDEFDAVPDSTCSLREAIQSTNNEANFGGCTGVGAYMGVHTVNLSPGTYQLSTPRTGPGNSNGDLEVESGQILSIEPPSGSGATIDGGDHDRVLANSGGLTLTRVTIQDGKTLADGGGIVNRSGGLLAIRNSAIVSNEAPEATRPGGGLAVSDVAVSTELTNVTISGNRAGYLGGGAFTFGTGPLTLSNVTVTGNSAGSGGGGIGVDGTATMSLRNTIVAGNTADSGGAHDCGHGISGEFESLGFNLIGTTSGCGSDIFMPVAGDLTNVGAQLGPLASNGGPTQTHALLAGSPAIDGGNPAAVGSGGNSCPATDQRGTTRPQGSRCDIGAFELVPMPPAPLTTPPTGACAELTGKARKRCKCKQKKGKKRKTCLRKLKKGRKA